MCSTSKNLPLLQHIVSNLDIAIPSNEVITQDSLNALQFVKGTISPKGIIGIRRKAGDALSDLASNIFSSSQQYQRGATYPDIFNELANIIISHFFEKRTIKPEIKDALLIEAEIWNWFQANISTYEFYIPCSISPWPAPSFSMGHVMFVHVQEFAEQERKNLGIMFDITYEQMFETMDHAYASWIAKVEVSGCMQKRAQEIANLSVDVALGGLQLVVPLQHSSRLSRLTGRASPSFVQVVSRSSGKISSGTANQAPGLTMGEGILAHFLKTAQPLVNGVGNRVTAFVVGASAFPFLEQAWADAAYWFHEALAEPLDTIAVPKLETAIEVLLRAENNARCKAKVLKAISAFYGLTKDQPINPHSQLTVEKFATGFVTDRSRILHGTWSTLNHSLRESRPSLTSLVSGLLTAYALQLEQYSNASETIDDIEAFLAWIEVNRQPATSGTTSASEKA